MIQAEKEKNCKTNKEGSVSELGNLIQNVRMENKQKPYVREKNFNMIK